MECWSKTCRTLCLVQPVMALSDTLVDPVQGTLLETLWLWVHPLRQEAPAGAPRLATRGMCSPATASPGRTAPASASTLITAHLTGGSADDALGAGSTGMQVHNAQQRRQAEQRVVHTWWSASTAATCATTERLWAERPAAPRHAATTRRRHRAARRPRRNTSCTRQGKGHAHHRH